MAGDLQLAVAGSIFEIDAQQWDRCAGPTPILSHGFFRALELSGCVGDGSDVIPRYAVLVDRCGEVLACAPFMLKWGTRREFGPEFDWLLAGLESGCFAWPKLQACTPFFPRMAPKLLVRPDLPAVQLRGELLEAVYRLGREEGISAFNLMHLPPAEAEECRLRNAVISREFRSVWHNPGVGGVDEYLQLLPRKKRKTWLRERRRTASLGVKFDVVGGADISDELLADFYAGFEAVCGRHGNGPWIPQEMYRQLCRQIPESVLLMTAYDDDGFCAGGFRFVGGGTLYTDTFSAPEPPPPEVLFEMGCYRPIEYAIANGLTTVDGGLSAPHKSHRGYLTEPVFNAHWFTDGRLEALARERLRQIPQDSSE